MESEAVLELGAAVSEDEAREELGLDRLDEKRASGEVLVNEEAAAAAEVEDKQELVPDFPNSALSPQPSVLEERLQSSALERELEELRGRYVERLRSEPGVVPELIGGQTVAEIEQSYALAREAFARVVEKLKAVEPEREVFWPNSIPAGAGERRLLYNEVAGLKPVDKIAYGLGLRERS